MSFATCSRTKCCCPSYRLEWKRLWCDKPPRCLGCVVGGEPLCTRDKFECCLSTYSYRLIFGYRVCFLQVKCLHCFGHCQNKKINKMLKKLVKICSPMVVDAIGRRVVSVVLISFLQLLLELSFNKLLFNSSIFSRWRRCTAFDVCIVRANVKWRCRCLPLAR